MTAESKTTLMPDSHAFRQLMGCFATGITVVTVNGPGAEPAGITINSLTSVSLKPPLVLFCLDKAAHVYPVFKKSKNFAVNILSATQEDISRHFADRRNPLPKKLWDTPRENCPIIRGTLGWMICKTVKTYAGGDHTIFMGEVVQLKKRPGALDPLLYFQGKYRKIKE